MPSGPPSSPQEVRRRKRRQLPVDGAGSTEEVDAVGRQAQVLALPQACTGGQDDHRPVPILDLLDKALQASVDSGRTCLRSTLGEPSGVARARRDPVIPHRGVETWLALMAGPLCAHSGRTVGRLSGMAVRC